MNLGQITIDLMQQVAEETCNCLHHAVKRANQKTAKEAGDSITLGHSKEMDMTEEACKHLCGLIPEIGNTKLEAYDLAISAAALHNRPVIKQALEAIRQAATILDSEEFRKAFHEEAQTAQREREAELVKQAAEEELKGEQHEETQQEAPNAPIGKDHDQF